MSNKPSALRSYINETLDGLFSPFAIELDTKHKVTSLEGRKPSGLPAIKRGEILTRKLPFLEPFLDSENTPGDITRLPYMTLNDGVTVHLMIENLEDGGTRLLLLDASEEHDIRQRDQQLRHEAELSDVEQQKYLDRLQEAQRLIEAKNAELKKANQAKSNFIASMSHEFRTPLTSIMGYNDLLKMIVVSPSQSVDYINAVDRGAKHLLLMIDNLLDQARIEAGELDLLPQPGRPETVLEECYEMLKPLAARKDLAFKIDIITPATRDILIDSLRFRQIMLNIINNAIKYTEEGSVTITSKWKDNWLDVTVEDTGPGIPESNLKTLFSPFIRVFNAYTTTQPGAGLGLSISRHLAKRMGGSIEYQPGETGGSVFTISLPAILVDVDETEEELDTNRSTVLVAEDDPDIRLLIEINMFQKGFAVISCANGQEAITTVREKHPDIILMDMNMPVMDGAEATRILRSEGYKDPIIALTASSFRNAALDAGCNDYVAKPLKMDDLYATVRRYTGEQE